MKLLFWKKSNRKVLKRPRLYRMRRSLIDWGLLFTKIIATIATSWGLYHFFMISDYFRINHVSIQGELEHVDSEMIRKISQVQEGQNIFSTNLFGIAQNVKKISWINRVQVRRQLPSGLVIRVDEHQPFAVLEAAAVEGGKKYFLMSREGVLFKHIDSKIDDLPLITGFSEERMRKYPGYYRGALKSVYDFLKTVNKMSYGDFSLRQLSYDETMGFTAFLWFEEAGAFVKVYFGNDSDEKSLSLLNRMFATMKAEGVFYTKVDLHVKGKAFVRL